jgi:type I restriction enzyme S subunit
MKLGEVFKLSSGKSLPEKKRIPGNCNVYGGNGITGCHNDYFVEKSTIVIGRVGEYCGTVHLTSDKCWVTDNALMVTEWYIDVDKKYLEYALNSLNLHQYAKTVGQPSISQGNIYGLDIDIPNKETQQEIVQILNRTKEVILQRNNQLQELDNLIKARFVELFDNGNYPKIKLGDACKKITDGTHKTPNYLDEGITFISAKNIVDGELDFSDVKHISEEEYQEIQKRCQTEINDILLSKSGSLGSPVIVRTEEKLGLFESLAVLKYERERFLPEFLCEQLKTDMVQRQFTTGTKGVAIKHLHLGVIAETEIIEPPMEEQKAFAGFVKQVDKSKVAVQKALDETQTLFDCLMQEYFG